MGQQDNPRRIRNTLIAAGIGALLLAGSGTYAIHQQSYIYQQDKAIHAYQHKLNEQGSLIDQQKKQLSNQNRNINTINQKTNSLNQKVNDLNQQLDSKQKEEDSYQKEIEDLKNQLAFKKADEARLAAQQAAKKVEAASQPSAAQGRTVTVEATGYIAQCTEGCTGITATGYNLAANPDAKVIAVDPDVIPLGSHVYVPGYGEAVAADTGGAINGNKIDIHFANTSQALDWGRKTVQVTVMD